MKKRCIKISLIILVVIFSVYTIVLADNNIIDINTLLNNNIIENGVTKNSVNEEKIEKYSEDVEINNAPQSRVVQYKSQQILEDGIYRIAIYSNQNIGLDIDGASKSSQANVIIWEWHENNIQKQFELEYGNDGYYIIRNKNSNKVLDVQNAGSTSGTNVWQYDYNGKDSQKWIIQQNSNGSYSIISKLNGLYLDVANGSISNGSNIQVYEGNGSVAQQFNFIRLDKKEELIEGGTYRIAMFSNQNIGLDIDGSSKECGANVLIWQWNENNIQKEFNIRYSEKDGAYTIANVNSGMLLDVQNAGNTSGTNVWQYEENNTDSQKWKIVKNSNGSYSIISKLNGLYLDISNANISNGGNVQVYEGNGSVAQQFCLIKITDKIEKTVSNGVYEIISTINSNKAFDMTDNSIEDGAKVQLWDSDGFIQQRYKITYNNTYYTITSMNSNKVLAVNNSNNIIQKTSNGSIDEKWRIKAYSNGQYAFCSLYNGFCIDIPSANASNGIKLQAYEGNNSVAQKFYLIDRTPMQGTKTIEDGIYKIGTAINSNQVFDMTDGSTQERQQIQLWNNWEAVQQNFEIKYVGDGYYTIKSKLSDKLLAVEDMNTKNETKIIQQTEKGTDAEKWIINNEGNGTYSIISKCNNYYMDVPSANTSNGIKMQMYENNGTISQRFKFIQIGAERTLQDGTYRIAMHSNSNIGLDINGASKNNGANVIIWEWLANNIQKEFNLEYIEADGCYIIRNVNSGKVLDCENGGTSNYTNVWQYEYNGTSAQKWYIKKNSNGSYSIFSKASGLALDISNATIANGSNVQIYTSNNSIAQQFDFIKQTDKTERYLEDGLYKIVMKTNKNMGLDIADASQDNGANLQLWQYHSVAQENFKLTYENGYYIISPSHSNKVLEIKSNNNIEQNEKNNSNDNQKWLLIPDDEGAYNIVSKSNGLYMDVANGSMTNGANIRGYSGNGSVAQLFVFQNAGLNIDPNKYPGIQEKVSQIMQKHPNWRFEPVYLNLDFNEAVEGEYKSNRTNLVDTTVYQGEWIRENPYSSGEWYSASRKAIAYFMDPRNFLDDVNVFQFQYLNDYLNGVATLEGIQNQVNGTFLNNYANDINTACLNQNVNPYYVIARLFQEQGRNGTTIGTGMNGGDGKTYYNPFNIGANLGNDYETALATAKKYGWDSMQKAIQGGIDFLKANWLENKQNTLYLNKFDVDASNGTNLYEHQYMQNLSAAYSEARTLRGCYVNTGKLESEFVFYIPLYENMPTEVSPMPVNNVDETAMSAKIVNIDSLEIKETTQENAKVLGTLSKGETVLSVERAVNGNWSKIVTDKQVNGYNIIGYVSGDYLEFINDKTNSNYIATVKTQDGIGVNVRSGPSTEFSKVGAFQDGTTVTVISTGVYHTKKSDGSSDFWWDWCIAEGGRKVFIPTKYLQK